MHHVDLALDDKRDETWERGWICPKTRQYYVKLEVRRDEPPEMECPYCTKGK